MEVGGMKAVMADLGKFSPFSLALSVDESWSKQGLESAQLVSGCVMASI